MIRTVVTFRELVGHPWRNQYPNHCPVKMRDGDGKSVGACWHHLRDGCCPDHGQIYTAKLEEKAVNKIPHSYLRTHCNFNPRVCFLRWITGFLEIFDGLSQILTLGIYSLNWTMDYVFWASKRECRKQLKKMGR